MTMDRRGKGHGQGTIRERHGLEEVCNSCHPKGLNIILTNKWFIIFDFLDQRFVQHYIRSAHRLGSFWVITFCQYTFGDFVGK